MAAILLSHAWISNTMNRKHDDAGFVLYNLETPRVTFGQWWKMFAETVAEWLYPLESSCEVCPCRNIFATSADAASQFTQRGAVYADLPSTPPSPCPARRA